MAAAHSGKIDGFIHKRDNAVRLLSDDGLHLDVFCIFVMYAMNDRSGSGKPTGNALVKNPL